MTRKELTMYTGGGLSHPSKMPCPSYSIPADRCKTGGKLREVENSTCSNCYACKGFYNFPNVHNRLEARYQSIGTPQWVNAMIELIRPHKYFRWHDSGDLQSLSHFRKIVQVCRQTPRTQHWLPTREPQIITQYLKQGGTLPTNLTIRISAALIDSDHYTHVAGCQGSGVYTTGYTCPAPHQDNQCQDCRICWDQTIEFVTYNKH